MFTIYNATILTMNSDQTYYQDGAMTIENGIITQIGDTKNIEIKGEAIDMKGKIVMPGLINTHTHSHSSIFRNLGDDMKLMDWLNFAMWPMEKALTADIAKDATALSCLEYLKNGITTYADQFYYANDIVYPAMESGLRCFLSATVFENPCAETDDTMAKAEEFIEKWIGREEETLIYPCFGPHAPYSVSAELYQRITEIALKHDVIVHTHISETEDENNMIKEKYGYSPTKWLDSIGVFKAKVIAAHSIHLSDEDIEIYRKNNVSVTYNPVSNLKLVSGNMPIEKMDGITVSIGTDGAQSNNSMDLLQDIKIGTLIQKLKLSDATFLDAEKCMKMLTIDGAKALHMQDKIGSLEIGKYADFISLDTTSINLTPLHKDNLKNIYATIIYSALGTDVSDSVVNGKFVMRSKEVLSMDENDVLLRGQKASEYLVKESKKYLNN